MIYENIKGIYRPVNSVISGGVNHQLNKRYEIVKGIYKLVYDGNKKYVFKQVANIAFTMSATKTLNISTSINFSSVTLDGIDDIISKYYIYSVGGTLFYSNNTFAGSICLYYSGDTGINFISTTGKSTLANTNGNINVQYGGIYGYHIFDNTVKNFRLSDLKKINRVRLCCNGSWHNNYTNISGFNIFLYDLVEVE